MTSLNSTLKVKQKKIRVGRDPTLCVVIFRGAAIKLRLGVVSKSCHTQSGIGVDANTILACVARDHRSREKGQFSSNTHLIDEISKVGVPCLSCRVGREVVVVF